MKGWMRIYAPVLVLLVWALIAAVCGLGPAVGPVAAGTITYAVWLQWRETRRRHRRWSGRTRAHRGR